MEQEFDETIFTESPFDETMLLGNTVFNEDSIYDILNATIDPDLMKEVADSMLEFNGGGSGDGGYIGKGDDDGDNPSANRTGWLVYLAKKQPKVGDKRVVAHARIDAGVLERRQAERM